MSDQKIKIGITLGDINGVGPEVVVKMLSDNRICELFTPVVYGSAKALTYYKNTLEGCEGFAWAQIGNAREVRPKRVNLINVMGDEARPEPGVMSYEAGRCAVKALQAAVADVKGGYIDAIVTAPVSKENVQGDDFNYTGHTEYFAAEFGGQPIMMLCSDLMKVGLVTIHLPVAQVSDNITRKKIVGCLQRLRRSLIEDFGIVEPRIAVLALNPHAGDGGLLGAEEQEVIKPAIEEAYAQKILAFGPFAADGLFASGGYGRYDAVLAMYHDQGLAPFKALSPWGVNFTAGLPVVRTSPDHGVAFDIAGKGVADESSMRSAVYAAIDIFRNRAIYREMSKNPLRRYERDRGADVSVSDLPQAPED